MLNPLKITSKLCFVYVRFFAFICLQFIEIGLGIFQIFVLTKLHLGQIPNTLSILIRRCMFSLGLNFECTQDSIFIKERMKGFFIFSGHF